MNRALLANSHVPAIATRNEFLQILNRNPVLTKVGSRFEQNIWILTEGEDSGRKPKAYCQIDFRMEKKILVGKGASAWLPPGKTLLDYPDLHRTIKEVFAASILVPRNYRDFAFSTSQLVNLWTGFRVLIESMVKANIYSFATLTSYKANHLVNERSSLPLARALKHLDNYQDLLGFRLSFSPDAISSSLIRTINASKTQTKPIPDAIFEKLLTSAILWVEDRASYTLKLYREAKIHKNTGFRNEVRFGPRFWHKVSRIRYGNPKDRFRIKSIDELAAAISWLRYSALVLITALTGLRISELIVLDEDSLESSTECGIRYWWIKSKHVKLSQRYGGEIEQWLCGPLAAKAFRILLELSRSRRRALKSKYVITPLDLGRGRAPAKYLPRRLCADSKSFARKLFSLPGGSGEKHHWHGYLRTCGLLDTAGNVIHIHAHQFRRTFARWSARSDTQTGLLALKDHFKHASFLMTHYYGNVDDELIEAFENERRELQIEAFDRVMQAEAIAGIGGITMKRKIDAAIASGGLPRNFRGLAGSHMRREIIVKWFQSGIQLKMCSGHFCIPRDGSVRCDALNGLGCNASRCDRAAFLPEHAPGLAMKIQSERAALQMQREYGQETPYLTELETTIREEERILKVISEG